METQASTGKQKKRPVQQSLYQKSQEEKQKLIEKVIQVNRCAKVVKGGRRFHFSALVIVGDGQGQIGCGLGKANEVADAIRKATTAAQKRMTRIYLKEGTIPHEVLGHYGAGKVLMKPASAGTGIIAGGVVRSLCEAIGIRDILTKNIGSGNAINVVRATLSGFESLSDHKLRFDENEIQDTV
jgi:small subunit ribosomal protein S5